VAAWKAKRLKRLSGGGIFIMLHSGKGGGARFDYVPLFIG